MTKIRYIAEQLIFSDTQSSNLPNPSTSNVKMYRKLDGFWYEKDENGNESRISYKETFNTVSRNLDSYDDTRTYNANGDIDTVVYDLGNGQSITKTINYLPNGDIDTVVLSGDTPAGIDLTKTIVYNVDGDIVDRNYN